MTSLLGWSHYSVSDVISGQFQYWFHCDRSGFGFDPFNLSFLNGSPTFFLPGPTLKVNTFSQSSSRYVPCDVSETSVMKAQRERAKFGIESNLYPGFRTVPFRIALLAIIIYKPRLRCEVGHYLRMSVDLGLEFDRGHRFGCQKLSGRFVSDRTVGGSLLTWWGLHLEARRQKSQSLVR